MRRTWHIAGWVLGAMIAVIVVLAGALMLIANTDAGRGLIERGVARASHGQVLLQGLSGRFPDHLRLRQLSLSDPQGQWLQADELALDWSALQLLERRAHLQRLTAASVVVQRRPAYTGGRDRRHGGSALHLPVVVQIDQLLLPRLRLGAALAGSPVALQLQGSGRFVSLQRASLQLAVRRLDQLPATYRAQAQLDARHIQLQLDVQEDSGGPLANLLRLPGLGALAVHLQLSGPRDALATQLDARAGALSARASGTLDLPGRSAVLDLSLQSAAMSPRAGLSWQRVSLQAHTSGSLTAPSTTAQLALSGLREGNLRFDSLQAEVHGRGRALALDATLAGATLPAPLGTLLHDAPIRLRGQVQLAGAGGTVFDLTLSHPLIAAQAHYQFGAGAPSGSFTASVPRLAPWAALARTQLQGSAAVQGNLTVAGATRQLALSAALNVTGGQARWVSLLGRRAELSAVGSYDDGGLHLQRSQLRGAHLQASAHGDDRGGRLDISWQLTLPQLAALVPQATGQLRAQGRLQGVLPRLALMVGVDGAFAVRGAPASIHVALQASDLPQRPSGRIELSGALDHAPLRLAAALQPAADGTLALLLQQGEWKSLRAGGTLHLAGASTQATPQGQLSLRIARLADLDTVLGRPVQGSLDASVALERSGARSRARLTLQARDLAVPAQPLAVQQLQVQGDIDGPLRQPRLALQLSAQGSLRGVAARLAASANGPLSALQLRAAVTTGGAPVTTGAAVADAPVLQAQALWQGDEGELELQRLSASYRGQVLRLLAPARVSLRGGVAVDRLRVGLGAAVVEIDGRVMPTLDLRASVSDFTPAVLGALMPQFRNVRAQGHADASARLQGSLSDPTGSLTLTAGGLGSGNGTAGGLPPGAIKVRAQLAAGAADINVAIDAGAQMQLQASGHLPLHRTVPMSLKMTGHMNLALANPVLEAGGQRVLGQLGIEAQLSGTLADPQARGKLTLMHADLQDYARGVHIANIDGTLEADGSQLRLTALTAHAGSGTISASGGVNLGAPGMPVQLHLTASHAQALKSDLLTADLNMDLRVTGAMLPRRLSAAGTVRVNSATINIPNALPPDVPVLNVVRPGQQAPAPAPARPLLADLNLTVNAPTGIFVRGRGLTAQVGGTVHATGSSSRPNVAGGFDLINGTFDIAGATLTFSSGRISFNGTGLRHKIDPTLDFTATTYTGGITATLNVGGYADAPVITLSSMPALPQDEILARLLFGESVSQLSALQIAGIGAALVTMTGVGGGGFNPLTTVQRALGLNRLVVSGGSSSSTGTSTSAGSTTQNNGATIEAGRYITNRIYIGAKQSTNGLSQAQVQVDLTRKWKLQTTLSTGGGTVQGATPENDPGSSIGMSYQFDY
ncbi:MAG TPA: translocation/assembly module TamB domain-containing protein [Steroidobacteraceae bacterium]|nr:translocation/assembly module TamB domain-containing protein [Steroidobacteraceae bacterium]